MPPRGRKPPHQQRRRSRSASPDQGSAAPAQTSSQNQQSSHGFEVRRAVAAAFAKFSNELQGISKDSVMEGVFAACDAASHFDPASGSAESALENLQTTLDTIFK